MTDILIGTAVLGALILFVVAYIGSAAWVVRDAQERGHTGGFMVLLIWMFGPLAALLWLVMRTESSPLSTREPTAYTNAEDALEAASRLDQLGHWQSATELYESTARRWPEHAAYSASCLERLREKQQLGTSGVDG